MLAKNDSLIGEEILAGFEIKIAKFFEEYSSLNLPHKHG